jgi:hypothetical protein
MPANFTALRNQFAAALAALEVAAVTDPTMDAYDGTIVLAGATAFRLADLTCSTVDHGTAEVGTDGVRARFSRGWADLVDVSNCDTSGEAAILSVFADLIGAVAHDNASREQNAYAKAASFALQGAAALLYLATDPEPGNPVEVSARAGALVTADDRLTHAHAWLAHLGRTS